MPHRGPNCRGDRRNSGDPPRKGRPASEVRVQLARAFAGRWTSPGNALIYCIDETDNGDGLHRIALSREARLEARKEPNLLGGIVTLSAIGEKAEADNWGRELYRPEPPATEEMTLKAVPHFAWDNRDPGEMLVWLREG